MFAYGTIISGDEIATVIQILLTTKKCIGESKAQRSPGFLNRLIAFKK